MKQITKILIIMALILIGIFLSSCNQKAPSEYIDGAFPNVETNSATPELTPTQAPTITPEVTPVVNTNPSENSEDTSVKNPGAGADLLYEDVLGRYATSYQSSSEARKKNIENAAKKINGISLLPGEIFSCHEVLEPFTVDNGYAIASAYEDGKIISSIGGGVCQISSTLYNAVLEAELEIVERHSHSMTVRYVDLSRDAAIAGDYMDFKFKNTSFHAIIIEAVASNGILTFLIVGEEERDLSTREIEYETVILSETMPPKDVVSYDDTKPTSYVKVTQSAYTGYETELYKVIYHNGKETERQLINTSVYEAAPQYITIGTLKE